MLQLTHPTICQDQCACTSALRPPICGSQGIGPATASAVLAAHCPDLPFMSDEAMAAALPGGKDYTVAKYLQLAAALRKRAVSLGDRGACRTWICAISLVACWRTDAQLAEPLVPQTHPECIPTCSLAKTLTLHHTASPQHDWRAVLQATALRGLHVTWNEHCGPPPLPLRLLQRPNGNLAALASPARNDHTQQAASRRAVGRKQRGRSS